MDNEIVNCPACNAENDVESLLGWLGSTAHCRCRHCGMTFTLQADEPAAWEVD